MTVAASQYGSTLPSTDFLTTLAGIQDTVLRLQSALDELRAQIGAGAAAGAATIGGGEPTPSSCSCSGAKGALEGSDQIGQAPPSKGGTGANAAPSLDDAPVEASRSDDPAPAGKGEKSSKASSTTSSGSSLGEKLVSEAKKHLGKKYVWAAAGPNAFDCSGLIQYAAKKLGINLPHKASLQAKEGKAVAKEDLKAGDLVYFRTGRGISHVGMYVGDGNFIHAAGKGKDVRISKLSEPWYRDKYAGARRLG